MGVKSFRELEVWQVSMTLVERVYRSLRTFPKEEQYALCDQLRRALVSIPSNIAEGFGRDSHKDFSHFLSLARGSLYEVSTQLEIAERLGYCKQDDETVALMNSISKLISALKRSLASTPSTHSAPSTKHQAPRTT